MFLPPAHFTTERLSARPPSPDDAPAAFATYASDPEVTRYLAWPPYREPAPLADFFRLRVADWSTEHHHFTWLLFRRDDGTMVGTIGCIPDGGKVVLGYALGRAHWGKGYAPEALRYLVDWALQQPGIHRAWAFCDVENPASRRVMEKAGMTCEGVLRRWHNAPNLGPDLRDCYVCARVN